MTKKDYVIIAQGLKDSTSERPVVYSQEYHALLIQWNVTVENVAYHLAKDNPKFHRNTFLTACDYQSGGFRE